MGIISNIKALSGLGIFCDGTRGGGVCGRGGAGMNIGGMLGSVTFPLAMWVASLEWVWVAMVGLMGDC